MSEKAHQTSGERLLNQALQSQGNARAQFAKPVNIGGKAYYMVVLQGGEFKNLQYDHIPTKKVYEVAETLFSAHKHASSTERTREIDYIDTRGVHYRDRSFTSHDEAPLTKEGKQFTHRQFLDSAKDIAEFSERLEKVPNPTDSIEWKEIPKPMRSALKESRLKKASYTKQELQQHTLIYIKHEIVKYGEKFAKDLTPEMARKLTHTLDLVITEATDTKELLKKSENAIGKCSTARASWNAMKKTLQSTQLFFIPAQTEHSRTQSFDPSQYEVFSKSGTEEEEFSLDSDLSEGWFNPFESTTSLDPLPVFQTSGNKEKNLDSPLVSPTDDTEDDNIEFQTINTSEEDFQQPNNQYGETSLRSLDLNSEQTHPFSFGSSTQEEEHFTPPTSFDSFNEEEPENTLSPFTSSTSFIQFVTPLSSNKPNSILQTDKNFSDQLLQEDGLEDQKTSKKTVFEPRNSFEEEGTLSKQTYMWNPQKVTSGQKQRRVEKDNGEKYREVMALAQKAVTLESIKGFQGIALSALEKLTGKENDAFTNEELQVIKFAQANLEKLTTFYSGLVNDQQRWNGLLNEIQRLAKI